MYSNTSASAHSFKMDVERLPRGPSLLTSEFQLSGDEAIRQKSAERDFSFKADA